MRDNDTNSSKGFAFINFASFDAADAALEAMNGQHLCNRPITISYAFKKDAKGERHGTEAERFLAAQNPLPQAERPHQLFADAPPTHPNAIPNQQMQPPPPPMMPMLQMQMYPPMPPNPFFQMQMYPPMPPNPFAFGPGPNSMPNPMFMNMNPALIRAQPPPPPPSHQLHQHQMQLGMLAPPPPPVPPPPPPPSMPPPPPPR